MRRIRGFSLIELIVVVGVIGTLAGVILFAIDPVAQIKRNRDVSRKANLENIRTALEIYRSDVGVYPASFPCGGPLAVGNTTYMNEVPCDPVFGVGDVNNGNSYFYALASDGLGYTLYACLEYSQDPEKDPITQNDCVSRTGASYTLLNP